MDAEKLMQERADNMHAVLNNVVPSRVPINVSLNLYAAAEYAKIDPRKAYWDLGVLEEAANELCEMIPSDSALVGMGVLSPAKYQALGSKAIVMGNNGFLQHPNHHMMEAEEYDDFIKDPYAFIVEKAVPRMNNNLDVNNDPGRATMAINQANQILTTIMGNARSLSMKLSKKFGYPSRVMGGGGSYAPMDILSDQLRSFTGMCTDIRRHRDKILEAVEAVSPLNYHVSRPPDPETYSRDAYGFYPLHMATFMRTKDFEELWWPSFFRQWNDLAADGFRCAAFLEDDWTNLLDYVQELPTGSLFTFEYSDPKKFKEKLGNKFILSGGFPVKYLTQCTKQEAIDKTKEWLDIMAPGGNYIFGFDKGILTMADCNLENLKAVVETVLKEGTYSNAGQSTGEIFNKDDYTKSDLPKFTSRMYKTWEEYKTEHPNTPDEAEKTVMDVENATVKFYYSLLQ